MKFNYKLSICMMVKNEQKNLKRCLDSLKPLLNYSDVELIIVDTGSSDNTVGIAKEYTDKVYFYEWNNNFSEVRNVTISYAKGKWILIIDADEVLVDALELYDLISDEALQSFNTFIFKIKNYTSMVNKSMFTILPQERIFKNDGFCFEGAVHNQPKFKPPLLDTDIYIDHYGYIFFGDRELREKKFIRTGGILKKELEVDPNNIYYRYQLARSYFAHGDAKDALEQIKIAYELLSKEPKNVKFMYSYVFKEFAYILNKSSLFEETVGVCLEGIEVRDDYIDLYFLLAFAKENLKLYNESSEYFQYYLKLVSNYNNLKIATDRSIEMQFLDTFSKDTALYCISNKYFNEKNFEKAYNFAVQITDAEFKINSTVKSALKLYKFDELNEFYNEIADDIKFRDLFTIELEKEKSELDVDTCLQLEKVFSNGSDIYSLLNKIRISNEDEKENLVTSISTCDFNSLPSFYCEVFRNIRKYNRQAINTYKHMKNSKIRQHISTLVNKFSDVGEYFIEYLSEIKIRDNDFNSLRVYTCISGTILWVEAEKAKKEGREAIKVLDPIFKLYLEKGFLYLTSLYNFEKLRMFYNTIDNVEEHFLIAMFFAREAVSRNDLKSGMRYFREAFNIYPYMGCYMQFYKDQLFVNSCQECD